MDVVGEWIKYTDRIMQESDESDGRRDGGVWDLIIIPRLIMPIKPELYR